MTKQLDLDTLLAAAQYAVKDELIVLEYTKHKVRIGDFVYDGGSYTRDEMILNALTSYLKWKAEGNKKSPDAPISCPHNVTGSIYLVNGLKAVRCHLCNAEWTE